MVLRFWKPKVLYARISDPINESLHSRLDQVLSRLLFTPKLLAFSINTNEGTYVQAELISSLLHKYSAKFSCPLYMFAEDIAMGPGYLLLSSGHKAFADNFSLIGGVSASVNSLDLREVSKHLSVKLNIESIGKHKVRNFPFVELTEENKAWVQRLLDTRITAVKGLILERRGNRIPRDKSIEDLALSGETFTVDKALKLGLVDDVKSFVEVFEKGYYDCQVKEVKLDRKNWKWFGNKQIAVSGLLDGINQSMVCNRLSSKLIN